MRDARATPHWKSGLVLNRRSVPGPPDTKITDVEITVISIDVDAVVESIRHQEIIEKLGLFELILRHDLANQGGASPLLKRWGDGISEMVVAVVSGDVVRAHVKKNIVFEDLQFLVPGERGQEIRTEQAKEVMRYVHAQRILILALRELFDDGEEKPDFTGREILEMVGHVSW
jgi:hypothetical protein